MVMLGLKSGAKSEPADMQVAQQSIDAANLNSPAPSERSTSIGDFRFAGVSVEEIRQLHERVCVPDD